MQYYSVSDRLQHLDLKLKMKRADLLEHELHPDRLHLLELPREWPRHDPGDRWFLLFVFLTPRQA
jgi:hypothetical protein